MKNWVKPRTGILKDLVQIVLGTAVFLWGVYAFVYKEMIVPRRRPATLVVAPSLERIGRKRDMEMVRVTFVFSNPSEARIYAPAIWYALYGTKYESTPDVADTTYVRRNKTWDKHREATARFSRVEADELIGVGRYSADAGVWFEPGSERRWEEILLVPANRYDALLFIPQWFVTKGIGDLAPMVWHVDPDGALMPEVFLKRFGYAWDTTRVMSLNDLRGVPEWMSRTYASWDRAAVRISLWGQDSTPRAIPAQGFASQDPPR